MFSLSNASSYFFSLYKKRLQSYQYEKNINEESEESVKDSENEESREEEEDKSTVTWNKISSKKDEEAYELKCPFSDILFLELRKNLSTPLLQDNIYAIINKIRRWFDIRASFW